MISHALKIGFKGVDVIKMLASSSMSCVEAIEKILPLREAELVMIAKTSISKDTSDNAVIIQPLYKH